MGALDWPACARYARGRVRSWAESAGLPIRGGAGGTPGWLCGRVAACLALRADRWYALCGGAPRSPCPRPGRAWSAASTRARFAGGRRGLRRAPRPRVRQGAGSGRRDCPRGSAKDGDGRSRRKGAPTRRLGRRRARGGREKPAPARPRGARGETGGPRSNPFPGGRRPRKPRSDSPRGCPVWGWVGGSPLLRRPPGGGTH